MCCEVFDIFVLDRQSFPQNFFHCRIMRQIYGKMMAQSWHVFLVMPLARAYCNLGTKYTNDFRNMRKGNFRRPWIRLPIRCVQAPLRLAGIRDLNMVQICGLSYWCHNRCTCYVGNQQRYSDCLDAITKTDAYAVCGCSYIKRFIWNLSSLSYMFKHHQLPQCKSS